VEPKQIEINVQNCGSCDQQHRVMATEYMAGSTHTHWYLCPTTGDPVPLRMEIEGERLHIVNTEFLGHMMTAEKAGSFMAALFWRDTEDGRVVIRSVVLPHNFPMPHESIRALREHLERDFGPEDTQRLPSAGPLPPVVQLFQKGDEGAVDIPAAKGRANS
jgi:hypothetical protein